MQCPGCGRSVPESTKFCAGCGARIEPAVIATCPQCGAAHAPEARFCKACGHAFVATADAPAATPPAVEATSVSAVAPTAPVAVSESTPPASAASAMVACSQCGAPHAAEAKFCKHCGQSFVQAPPPAVSARVPEPEVRHSAPPVIAETPTPIRHDPASSAAASAAPRARLDAPEPTALAQPAPPPPAPSSPTQMPPSAVPSIARDKSGPPGWLIGVIAAVVIVLVGGAGAFAYFKFMKPVPAQQTAAMTAVPESAPTASATNSTTLAASAVAEAGAPVSVPTTSAPSIVAPASEPMAPPQAVAEQPMQSPPATPLPQAAAPTPERAPPPVDHTLKIASELVRKGERAYSQGDYEEAVRHARSALDVRAGFAPAKQLLQRAYAAQKQIVQQQQREQQLAAEQQQAQAQAAAAARPKPPTPDEAYNQRAHSECARGLFGKACRHKVREEVCTGVTVGAPGASVCRQQD